MRDECYLLLKGTMATTDFPDELLEPGRIVGKRTGTSSSIDPAFVTPPAALALLRDHGSCGPLRMLAT